MEFKRIIIYLLCFCKITNRIPDEKAELRKHERKLLRHFYTTSLNFVKKRSKRSSLESTSPNGHSNPPKIKTTARETRNQSALAKGAGREGSSGKERWQRTLEPFRGGRPSSGSGSPWKIRLNCFSNRSP